MNKEIEKMLQKYNPVNETDKENAIKEIIQEIALCGLSKGGFFEKAAFYGGTCLRIFYGLDRFSEDLDFALVNEDDNFSLEKYFPYLQREFASYGLNIDVELKNKTKNNPVQSAFLKGNTYMLLMTFYDKSNDLKLNSNQKIKIKFEIDLNNPSGGIVEHKFKLLPSPYQIKVFDESTLFAGKIHAILCRNYKYNVKGRDYYDYLFYIAKGSKLNITYLERKLKNTGGIIDNDSQLTLEKVKELLENRFLETNYDLAKKDVINFISDKERINLWSKELFISTLEALSIKEN